MPSKPLPTSYDLQDYFHIYKMDLYYIVINGVFNPYIHGLLPRELEESTHQNPPSEAHI